MITLPKRLEAIANLIDEGASVADIGTDHGLLPVYLAQTGIARRIIATDSSEGSLKAARRNAKAYGVAEKIEIKAAHGLDRIGQRDVDTIVISGLGGETIWSILAPAPWTQKAVNSGNLKLILQPQTKHETLRNHLQEKGYKIKTEHTVTDRKHTYVILVL